MEEILIIDDSQQICAMLAEYVLPELGYSSAIANTGRQGLNRLRQKLPDLILLDLQLPDISGLDLLRLIAQEGYDVPVILMTAHGSEGIAVEAFRDRKSTRLNSSHDQISYAVFCLKKKTKINCSISH